MLAVVLAVLGVRSGQPLGSASVLAVVGAVAWRASGQGSWWLAACAAVLAGVAWLTPKASGGTRAVHGWAEAGACGLVAIALLVQAAVGLPGSAASLPLLLVGMWTIALGRTVQGGVVAVLAGVLVASEHQAGAAAAGAAVVLSAALALTVWPMVVSAGKRRALWAVSGACGLVLVALAPTPGLAWPGLAIATGCTLMLARCPPAVAPCIAGLGMILFGVHGGAPYAQPALLAGIVLNGAVLLACGRDRLVAMAAVLVMDAGLWLEIAHAPSRLALPLGLAITAWAAWRLQSAGPRRVLALAAAGHGGVVLAGCGLGQWALLVPVGHLACHALAHATSLLGDPRPGGRLGAMAMAGLPPSGLFFTQALFLRWAADAGWVVLPAAAVLTGFGWALLRAPPIGAGTQQPGLAWAPWAGSAVLGLMLWQAGR